MSLNPGAEGGSRPPAQEQSQIGPRGQESVQRGGHSEIGNNLSRGRTESPLGGNQNRLMRETGGGPTSFQRAILGARAVPPIIHGRGGSGPGERGSVRPETPGGRHVSAAEGARSKPAGDGQGGYRPGEVAYAASHEGPGKERPGQVHTQGVGSRSQEVVSKGPGASEGAGASASPEVHLPKLRTLSEGEYTAVGEAFGLTPGTKLQEGVTFRWLGPNRPSDAPAPSSDIESQRIRDRHRPASYMDKRGVHFGTAENPLHLSAENPQADAGIARMEQGVALLAKIADRTRDPAHYAGVAQARAALHTAKEKAHAVVQLTESLRTAQQHPDIEGFGTIAKDRRVQLDRLYGLEKKKK